MSKFTLEGYPDGTDFLAKEVLEEVPLTRPIGFMTDRLVPRYPSEEDTQISDRPRLDINTRLEGSKMRYEFVFNGSSAEVTPRQLAALAGKIIDVLWLGLPLSRDRSAGDDHSGRA